MELWCLVSGGTEVCKDLEASQPFYVAIHKPTNGGDHSPKSGENWLLRGEKILLF